MEVETKNKSIEIAKEAMEVDSSDSESYSTDEETDKNNSKKSNGSGNNVKSKLLLFKFDTTKKSNKIPSKNMDKSIENDEDDDDVVDISNEILVGDLNKKKRKRKNSSESKIKKKRKSVDKVEDKEVMLEGKEELKENLKSNENILKDDKEKVKPTEKCTVTKETEDKIDDKNVKEKDQVDSEKDSETSKALKMSAKKSPNPRKSKSNEISSGTPAKPLLTMDKFIIRKKTLEEVEQEKLAKQNEKKIDSDEIMIIEDDEVISKKIKSTPECCEKESLKKDLKKGGVDKCDILENKELEKADRACTETSKNSHTLEDMKQVNVVSTILSSNEKSPEDDKVLESANKTKKAEEKSTITPNIKSKKSSLVKISKISTEQTTDNTGKKSDSSSQAEKNEEESTADKNKEECTDEKNNEECAKSSDKEKISPPNKKSKRETENLTNSPDTNDNANNSADVSPKSNHDKSQGDQSTPLAKRRQSVNNRTPKLIPQRTLEPKKLTPKQIEKQEELARKKEELARKKEEKEQEKERQRLEKEQKKLEEEEKKRKEREEKEEAKRVEKEMKEKQRKEQEELRRKEKESKEQLRLMQIEMKNKEKAAREEERKAREDERRKKEEAEKEKKEKAAAAFASFFVAKKGGSGSGEELEEASAVPDAAPVEKQLNFMPFQIKGDMRMAPALRTSLTPERSALLDSTLHSSGEVIERDYLYLKELKREGYVIGKGEKTWPAETEEEPDVIIVESEFSEGFLTNEDSRGGFYNYPAKRVKRRAKLLQFHDNRRPPYFGTWSKKTQKISGRNPFKQDEAIFEYDVDSDDEWEEEGEGESLRGSDDEKEEEDEEGGDQYEVDNQMFVPHGYLSDEEEREDEEANVDPEAHKIKLKLMEMEFEEQMKRKTERLQPRLIGCVYLSNSGHYSTVTVGNHIRDLLLTRRAVYVESSIPITTTADETPPPPLTSSPTSNVTTESSGAANEKRLTCISDSEMIDLIKLVHGSYVSRKNLSKEFSTHVAANGKDISLGLIQKTIREIAEWVLCPLPECAPNTYPRKCWFVKPEIREKHGLADFLAFQNSWKFIVEPPTSEKRDSMGGTPSARKESDTPTSGCSRKEKDSNNTPTSSRKKVTKLSKRNKEGKTSNTPSGKKESASPLSSKEHISSSENEEKDLCSATNGESSASPHASLITKFTKVLSEEERIEQLNKTKVKPSPKQTKMMPKSKLELFKSQVRTDGASLTSSNTNCTGASTTGVVKKRAKLITIAQTMDAKSTDSNTKCESLGDENLSPSNMVTEKSSVQSAPQKLSVDNDKVGRTQNLEVIDLEDASNEATVETDQDKVENGVGDKVNDSSPPSVNKPKTPQSGSKVAKKRKSTPKSSGKATGDTSTGKPAASKTPVIALKTPVSGAKTSKQSTKTPNSGAKSSTNVSIMNFITKERPKRKSDDGSEEKKLDETNERKKMKLENDVEKKEESKTVREVECVQIESSNEGW